MYTRCSECETLFRVSREQLNAARGQVRCGHCGVVFDALTSLREEVGLPGDATNTVFPRAPEAESDSPIGTDDVAQDIHFEMLLDPIMLSPKRRKRWPWMLAAIALLLVTTAQIIHLQRLQILESPIFGPYISMAYSYIGHPIDIPEPIDLTAFVLLHHELVLHPSIPGALHLSGVLNNNADHPQPWPVLELKLEDRFGDVVAARRLGPEEYLRSQPAQNELMPANARRAIEISIVDPGEDAVGFNIDFCVMLEDGLRCAAQN